MSKHASREPKGSRVKTRPEAGNIAGLKNAPAETRAIVGWLDSVRFKKTLLGGADEADVWKKLDELNSLYEAALTAERLRYDALLAEKKEEEP